jgi:hypothetical protein
MGWPPTCWSPAATARSAFTAGELIPAARSILNRLIAADA